MRLREAKLNLDSFLKYNQPMSTDLNRLDNEITLITGASRGIGAGIAKLFAESGSYVIGTATTKEGAEAISQRFNQDSTKGEGIVLDVSNSEDVKKMIKEKAIISRSGKKLPTTFHSICLHSDTPNSVEISSQICILLHSMGVQQQTLPELF